MWNGKTILVNNGHFGNNPKCLYKIIKVYSKMGSKQALHCCRPVRTSWRDLKTESHYLTTFFSRYELRGQTTKNCLSLHKLDSTVGIGCMIIRKYNNVIKSQKETAWSWKCATHTQVTINANLLNYFAKTDQQRLSIRISVMVVNIVKARKKKRPK